MGHRHEGLHDTRTLPAFVRALAGAYGDAPAVDVDGDVVTYRQLEARSRQLAAALLARGVGKGSHVGMIFANGADFVVTMLAITRVGAVAVPLSTLLRPPELARALRHGDVRAVVAQRAYAGHDFADNLARALPSLETSVGETLHIRDAPFLQWIAFVDDDELPAWAHGPTWLASERGDELVDPAGDAVHANDPALLVYTSGQSAEPKGVLHGHGAILRKTHLLREAFAFTADSRVPGGLPFFWVGGLVMSVFPVLDGGGTITCRRRPFRSAPMLGAIGAARPDFRARGSATTKLVGLGMTETFGPYSWGVEPPHPDRPLTTPLVEFEPGYSIKVVDDTGAEVADGEIGEILLRGPTLMLGLYKVDRASTFDADGYYRTGDRAEVRGDTLFFVGRLGDMIKVSGANVSPAEVEHELLDIEGVAAAHVVGVDDPDRGQLVGAAIVPTDGASLDVGELLAALRDRLSSYKVPKLVAVVGDDDVPVLLSGKIDRRLLAEVIRVRSRADRPTKEAGSSRPPESTVRCFGEERAETNLSPRQP
jgi:acyl-CoA synthetase (AMP-forming)/AMP-acid ligase II